MKALQLKTNHTAAAGGLAAAAAGVGAPPESLSMAVTMVNIAAIHKTTGNYDTALHYLSRALSARKAHLGENHVDVATVISSIAEVHRLLGDHSVALRYYEWAYTIREMACGANTVRVVSSGPQPVLFSFLSFLLFQWLALSSLRPVFVFRETHVLLYPTYFFF